MNSRLKNKKEHKSLFNLLILFLVIAVLILSFSLRLDSLAEANPKKLDPDAIRYKIYADRFSLFSKDHGFYSAGFDGRESLFIFTASLFFKIFGSSDFSLRFLTLIFSVLVVWLTYKVSKELINPTAGLIAAFLVAINPYLIFNSTRGLRMETFTFLLLLMFYYLFVKEMDLKNRFIAACILGSLLCLLRIELLLVVPLILAYFFIKNAVRKPKTCKKLAIWTASCILIILMVVSPFLYNSYKEEGDPFFILSKHATAWRNYEFRDQEGFPTKEEVKKDLYVGLHTGNKETGIGYVFKLHTPTEIVEHIIGGYYRSFNRNIKVTNTEKTRFIFWIGILGILLMLFLRKLDIIIVMLASIFPNVFTMYLGGDTRHVMHIYPFFAIITAWFIYYILISIPKIDNYLRKI